MPISFPRRTRSQEISASRRPWSELFSHPSSYSFPSSSNEYSSRIRRNLNHFLVNYVEIVLSALIVTYFWHPFSFTVCLIFWVVIFYMYWFRKRQLVVLNRLVDDRVVLLTLVILTDVAVVFTGAWLNVLVSFIGVGMVVLHAAFRKSEDLFLNEEEAAEAGLVSAVGNGSNDEPLPPAAAKRRKLLLHRPASRKNMRIFLKL